MFDRPGVKELARGPARRNVNSTPASPRCPDVAECRSRAQHSTPATIPQPGVAGTKRRLRTRERRSRESGIREPAAGRRTILRRFVEDFTGKDPKASSATSPQRLHDGSGRQPRAARTPEDANIHLSDFLAQQSCPIILPHKHQFPLPRSIVAYGGPDPWRPRVTRPR